MKTINASLLTTLLLWFLSLPALGGKDSFTVGSFRYTPEKVCSPDYKKAVRVSYYQSDTLTADSKVLVIPNEVRHKNHTYAVTCIEAHGFECVNTIEEIVISEGIRSIHEGAFRECGNLKSIRLPKSVREVEESIFAGCNNLVNIEVDDANPFYDSREGCNAIIETSTNELCAGCKNTHIPSSVKKIGMKAFSCCYSMYSICIPEGVEEIKCAFENCIHLSEVSLPHSLTTLESGAFAGCKSLSLIYIPEKVTRIMGNPFVECSSLDSITVAAENERYDSRNGCNAIIETSTNSIVAGCSKTIIPPTVTGIKSFAFDGLQRLVQMNIPQSVKDIESGAIVNCPHLTQLTVEEGNPVYDSRKNCHAIVETKKNKIVVGCGATIIPSSIWEIGNRAFYGTLFSHTLFVPEGVETIGEWAFYECKNLQTVVLPVSIKNIGKSAFSGCHDLRHVSFNSLATEIPFSVFANCSQLHTVSLPNHLKTIQERAFLNCHSLETIRLPFSLTSIGKDAFRGCPCERHINKKFHRE